LNLIFEKQLKAIAKKTRISEAEIIRQAIDVHITSIPVSQTNLAANGSRERIY
jgi:predicted DNA-binding protein